MEVGCSVGSMAAKTDMGRERDWVSQAKKKKKGKEMKEYQSIHILVYFFENVCVCADIYQKQCKKKISKKEAANPPSLWLMVKGHSVTILSLHQVRPQAGCS